MVGSSRNDSHNMEADGAMQRSKKDYPNMELIGRTNIVTGRQCRDELAQKAKEVLKKVSWTSKVRQRNFASFAPGAGRAIEEAGLIGKVFAVGTGMPNEQGLLNSGAVSALTLWDPADAGCTYRASWRP